MPPITRRHALAGALSSASLFVLRPAAAAVPGAAPVSTEAALAALEARSTGRLGVSVLDTATGQRSGNRASERFPMCSTFKMLAAGFVLARVDRGEEKLDRRIVVKPSDLLSWSPVTEKRVGGEGMTLAELCEATMTTSDNAAANLILDTYGGPAGLTAWVRTLGDTVTRLDRRELELNEAIPGDPRDTTSPAAMLDTFRTLLFGTALAPASRERLSAWLVANKTGDARLRAGLPGGWRVGDKTGTSANGCTNDIAVAWPPGRAPILVTAYYAETTLPKEARDAVLAEVARIVTSGLQGAGGR